MLLRPEEPMATDISESAGLQPIGEDRSDPIVAQAIRNVTSRQLVGEARGLSRHQITQAIYDEIRRLDRARLNVAVITPIRPQVIRPGGPNSMAG
jgi:hypothetical protein